MKLRYAGLLLLAGAFVLGGVEGYSTKNTADLRPIFNSPTIENALSGATTTQPTDVYPDTTDPTFPIPQVYASGYANEGKPTSLFASGRPLLITAGSVSGSTSLYSNGSTTPLATAWGVTSGDSSLTSTNPVRFYPVANSFENYVPLTGSSGCSFFGGKMPVSCTANNLLTGDISIRMTGGQANWLVCGGGTKTTGKGVMELEGGSAKEAMGDWGNSSADKGVSSGVTINIRNDYSITYLAGSSTGNTAVDINLFDSPSIQRTYLSTVNNKRLNVGGVLSNKSKIGLLSPSQSFSASSDSTAIPEGTQLVYAADESYLANYKAIFSMFTMTTSSGTSVGYTGTKGEIVKSGNYLIYTYPTTRVSAPTPTSSYSQGVISGLIAGDTYLLTDSSKVVHTFVADANGQILVDKTNNPELIDTTIASLVQVREDAQTDDSAAQSVSYLMPATLATPAITYADETLSGLVDGYDYTFTFSDGTSTKVAAADHSTTLSVLGQSAFYGKTITGVVRNSSNGSEIDSLSESVSLAVPSRYATPESTFAEGIIASLKASTSYQLSYADSSGASHIKTITTNGEGAYLTYKDSDLSGMTITGITLIGDGGGLTSLPAAVSYAVPSQYAVVSPSYDTTSHVLSGLSANATYIVTDSSGATHEISTADATSVSLAEHPELAGLTLTSIQQKGDGKTTITSDKQASSLDYVAPSRRADDGSLAGLVAGSYDPSTDTLQTLSSATRYVLTTKEGTSVVILSDSEGKVDLSTYADLLGKTVTSVALKGTNADGDNTDYCDSLSATTSYQVLPHQALGTPSYDSATNLISGLTPNVCYRFSDASGNAYTGTSDAKGQLDPATLVDRTGSSIPGGTVLTSCVALGDQKATIDSYKNALSPTFSLPEREATPTSVYDQDEGQMSSLEANTAYRLTFSGSDGTISTIDITTNADGAIDVLVYPSLDQATITAVQKKATAANKMISIPQKTAYEVGLLSDVLTRKKTRFKEAIKQMIAKDIAASTVGDKDSLTKAMAAVEEKYDKAIDELPYTDAASYEAKTEELTAQIKEEYAYEVKRETTKEAIADLKRSCADDARVNAVIARYQSKLSGLRFGQDPLSAMDDVLAEAKTQVELATEKTAGVAALSNGESDPEKGMTNAEKDLYEATVTKIDNATSKGEIDSILAGYQTERTTLLANEAAATQRNYAIFAYVVLGVYVVFFALYFGILRHHKVDGVYLIAWAVELILLIVVTLLIKGNNPLAVALLWAFYALSIPLVFWPKKKKPAKDEAK
jgi:hypothetical protein